VASRRSFLKQGRNTYSATARAAMSGLLFAPGKKKETPDMDSLVQETTRRTGDRGQEKIGRVLKELNASTNNSVRHHVSS